MAKLSPCECGKCEWDGSKDDPRCVLCGRGPLTKSEYVTFFRANGRVQGIPLGEVYARVVTRTFHTHGPPLKRTSTAVRVPQTQDVLDQYAFDAAARAEAARQYRARRRMELVMAAAESADDTLQA